LTGVKPFCISSTKSSTTLYIDPLLDLCHLDNITMETRHSKQTRPIFFFAKLSKWSCCRTRCSVDLHHWTSTVARKRIKTDIPCVRSMFGKFPHAKFGICPSASLNQ
jgi:hypothetical protein